MSDIFFEQPILNSPYEYPSRHWEIDKVLKQPTNRVLERWRPAKYLSPIPKPKKQKRGQRDLVFRDEAAISTEEQQYDPTPLINELRAHVDRWRALATSQWNVTPETARLLEQYFNEMIDRVAVVTV